MALKVLSKQDGRYAASESLLDGLGREDSPAYLGEWVTFLHALASEPPGAEMSIERRIREYVTQELLYDRDLTTLGDDELLLGPGLLDSVAVLRLVAWIEEEFKVDVLGDEVVPENLETVNRVADLVRRKLAPPAV